MKDMRKLMQIIECASTIDDKQKLDESILGMVDIPSINAISTPVSEERSREEYETHITKGSYAPKNPMGDVQMEDAEDNLSSDDEEDELDEGITVVHEDDGDDAEAEVADDADDADVDAAVDLEESEIDPDLLAGLRRMFGTGGLW